MAMYENKTIMAPMVRVGILPMRLLALDHGADLVYSEEIIDFKLLNAERRDNAILGTVDFVLPDGTVIFRTCPREKDKVILQVGTSDAARALAAVKKVENYVSGVDVNMGCPKQFSIQGGMGAALLSHPDKACQILSTLVQGLSVPVTCKMRILPKLEDSLAFCKLLAGTGIKAIAVHGRTRQERPRHANHNDVIKAISEAISIPVIANGGSKDITCHEDIATFRKLSGCRSVMLARAAMYNCSIFSPGPLKPIKELIVSFLNYAIQYDTPHCLAKYCVQQMLHDDLESDQGRATLASYSLERLSQVWNLNEFYQNIKSQRPTVYPDPISLRLFWCSEEAVDGAEGKKRKLDNGSDDIIVKPYKYNRKQAHSDGLSPKMIVHEWARRHHHDPPDYDTTERTKDRYYHTILTVAGKRYSTPVWNKSKQIAEQSAGMVCLESLGIHDGNEYVPEAITKKQRKHLKPGTSDQSCGAIIKKDSGCKLKKKKKKKKKKTDKSVNNTENTSKNDCDINNTETEAIPLKPETAVDNNEILSKNMTLVHKDSCDNRNALTSCDVTGVCTHTGDQDTESTVSLGHCDTNAPASTSVCTNTDTESLEIISDHEQCGNNSNKRNNTDVIDRVTNQIDATDVHVQVT